MGFWSRTSDSIFVLIWAWGPWPRTKISCPIVIFSIFREMISTWWDQRMSWAWWSGPSVCEMYNKKQLPNAQMILDSFFSSQNVKRLTSIWYATSSVSSSSSSFLLHIVNGIVPKVPIVLTSRWEHVSPETKIFHYKNVLGLGTATSWNSNSFTYLEVIVLPVHQSAPPNLS